MKIIDLVQGNETLSDKYNRELMEADTVNDEDDPVVENDTHKEEPTDTESKDDTNKETEVSQDEDVEENFVEASNLIFNTDEHLYLYDKLDYLCDSIQSVGLSRDFVIGFNSSDDLYSILPDLPSLEELPLMGNPSDEISLESLDVVKGMLDKFWKWVKELVSSIKEIFTNLISKISNFVDAISSQIASNGVKISKMDIDHPKLQTTSVDLISYESHLSVMKALPALTSEIRVCAKGVEIYDWKGDVEKGLKLAGLTTAGLGGGLKAGHVIGKHKADAAYGDQLKAVAKQMKNHPGNSNATAKAQAFQKQLQSNHSSVVNKHTKIGLAVGAAVVAAPLAIVTTKMLANWIKWGCQFNREGLLDMSKFNEDKIFKSKKGTIAQLGWSQSNTSKTDDIRQLHHLVRQIDDTAKSVLRKMQRFEKEVSSKASALDKDTDAKALRIMRNTAKTQLNGATNVQRITSSMLQASIKLMRNFLSAQKAVLRCGA